MFSGQLLVKLFKTHRFCFEFGVFFCYNNNELFLSVKNINWRNALSNIV